LKVLIVDDEPDIVEILSYNLAKENFEIIKTYDGKQAISLATFNHPDVVIMDLWMPELSGMEVCRIMKKDSELKNIPIVILTADSDEYTGIEAVEAGCDQFVTKPVKPAFIVGLVKDLINHGSKLAS
jgi:two-component system alkaline phosphatase synthesis response regulator PhoP